MIELGMAVACLCLLLVGSLLWSQRSWRRQPTGSRRALHGQIYRRRLDELAAERAQDLLAEEGDERLALESSLLADLQDPEPATAALRAPAWPWWLGVGVALLLSLGVYWLVGGYRGQLALEHAETALPALSQRLLNQRQPASPEELATLKLGLRHRLASQPDDYRGWLLLGRLALEQQDAPTALESLALAYRLSGQQPLVLLPYSQALMLSGRFQQADELLRAWLADQPDSALGWNLLAWSALEQGQAEQAMDHWQRVLALLPADAPLAIQAREALATAKQSQLAMQPLLEVRVELAPGLALPADASLMLFVQAPEGGMPLLARKVGIRQLPQLITLSAADSPMGAWDPGKSGPWVLKGRLTGQANDAGPEAGLEGQMALSLDEKLNKVTLVIDRSL